MPSSQTSPRVLQKKIDELREKGDSQGLSAQNQNHLRFLELWKEHAFTDVVLVIEPKGAINLPGQRSTPRIIEVTDQRAADLLAFADQRGQLVRMADEKEIAAYHKYNAELTEAAKQNIANERMAAAQKQLNSILGVSAAQPVPTNIDAPVPASAAQAGRMGASERQAAAGRMKPVLPGLPEATDDEDAPTSTNSAQFLADNLNPEQAANILALGYSTVEAIAEASPSDLAAAHGVGKATAAKLLVAAAQAMSDEPPEEDE